MAIKLVAIDLDNTLLNSRGKLSSRVCETLKKASNQGVKIVLCTGRPFLGTVNLLKQLDLYDKDDEYIICFGGSLIQTTSKQIISKQDLPYLEYEELFNLNQTYNLNLVGVGTDRIYTSDFDTSIHLSDISTINRMPISFRTISEMNSISIIKAMFIENNGHLSNLVTAIKDKASDDIDSRLSFTKSRDYILEANAKDVSKGKALSFLTQKLGIMPNEVFAIGDQQNDESMIEFAGIGVAMGNAIDSLKEKATFVTTDNDHDGVAIAVEKFI